MSDKQTICDISPVTKGVFAPDGRHGSTKVFIPI